MAQFKAFSPKVEVNGQTVAAVVKGMGAFKATAMAILRANGLTDISDGTWHRQQAWLDTFAEITKKSGPATLTQIGRTIPECAKFPPEVKDLETALKAIDVAYRMNHRGGEIGCYKFEKIDAKSARMICRNPYPCDFDKGIISAMASRFANGRVVKVEHDGQAECRKKGAESCTYSIKW